MTPPNVVYGLVIHRGESRITIRFEFSETWNGRMRRMRGSKWSETLKCWHIPDTAENRKVCGLDPSLLPEESGFPDDEDFRRTERTAPLKAANKKSTQRGRHFSPENEACYRSFIQMLHLKAYSASTIKTYSNEFGVFLKTLGRHPAESLDANRIKDYLEYCSTQLGLSENAIHSRINALKFYYEQVLEREKFFWEIPRPKKPMLLPKLLNENELRRLFNALKNKKHKAMLFTCYSAGLRVSEIVKLKLADIDSNRMQIFIERAKGKKDRYVNLSPVLLDILRQYLKEYKPRPRIYLFESEATARPYPTRSVQQIFTNAKHKAGISKAVGIHSLRHSFATHLLDKGTDIRYIKELLGHFNIKTTERYLHVSKQQLVNIESPFDDLWRSKALEW